MRRLILFLLCYFIYKSECGKHLHNLTWETARERCIYKRIWIDRANSDKNAFMFKCLWMPDYIYWSREAALADGWCVMDNKKKQDKHFDCVKDMKDVKQRKEDIPKPPEKPEPKPKIKSKLK
ncbi:uncharacterized protein LOC117170089 [Belonocnema kinseyi]|uniref:uncharacterized protein LOC117170089 n=1 Tax=Belonocnema kinseyi TaxID=2817044 RepID=UPI00143E057B|nr:uncharacterized protein LOC117170089 [Belonocnema kinseyi]